ncbi:hypothetical protein ARMGADRAFT_899131, partial [Armillaria gallica]
QRTQTPADEKLRTALANMRYTSATKVDIAFLQSKVAGKPTAAKIMDKEFQNISIITRLNVHKDKYNRIGAIQFTEETGQELTVFYSDDKLSASENNGRASGKSFLLHNSVPVLCNATQLLWSASPSSNDKQIPPTLSLCKGMPIMIRTNSATELCITKGQEGTVYAWTEGTGPHGKRVFEVLFVSLIRPLSEVRVPGLPSNVVLVVCSSNTVICSLLDDTTVKLSYTQVEVIINFSMTDFASQGKTYPYNPVNLNNCRTHQSYYTALSQTAIAEGTLLLPALSNFCASLVDMHKIQGGCSGHLQQEFRELEMLDDITLQMYDGMLPVTVLGETQYSLIHSFQDYIGTEYTPPNMDTKLMWSVVDPFIMSSSMKTKPDSHLPELPSISLKKSSTIWNITTMKPAEKHKGHTSDTFDSKQAAMDKRAARSIAPNMPAGCEWSNNSCAYDAVLFILYNMWRSDDTQYSIEYMELHNQWLDMATASFRRHMLGEYSLEEVRDYIRRALHHEYPSDFVFGRNTSVKALMMQLLCCGDTFSSDTYLCQCGQSTPISMQQCCVVVPHSTAPLGWTTLQQFFNNTHSIPISTPESMCISCKRNAPRCTVYNMSPPVILMAVAFIETPPDESITLDTSNGLVCYKIVGIIYFGNNHFMARYIDHDNIIWFNNGMIQK